MLNAIRALEWDIGVEGASGTTLVQVLVAGFSAIAMFRRKLFSAAYP